MIQIDRWYQKDCTLGRGYISGFNFFTLELPWKDNQTDISCIPPGTYTYELYDSPKHGPVLLLLNVRGRTMIEMHKGNYTRDILGCILPGDGIKYLDGDSIPDVTNSTNTLNRILKLAGESGQITIK